MKAITAFVLLAILGGLGTSHADGTKQAKDKLAWVVINTPDYTIQLPTGWQAGPQTPFGQRTLSPRNSKSNTGEFMTAMTADGPTSESWDQLYHTALYFIGRAAGKNLLTPTPYRVLNGPQGTQSCSWEMHDAAGTVRGRYTILRDKSNHILALSVHIPKDAAISAKHLTQYFQHLVDTAVLHPASEHLASK